MFQCPRGCNYRWISLTQQNFWTFVGERHERKLYSLCVFVTLSVRYTHCIVSWQSTTETSTILRTNSCNHAPRGFEISSRLYLLPHLTSSPHCLKPCPGFSTFAAECFSEGRRPNYWCKGRKCFGFFFFLPTNQKAVQRCSADVTVSQQSLLAAKKGK